MNESFYEKMSRLFIVLLVIFMIYIVPLVVLLYSDKTYEELQVILKNECGMDYSVDEVRRNGRNLSRICGLKGANDD